MNVFPLAVNLFNESAILVEYLCVETAAEYFCKVKYFKINSDIIYRSLGLCFYYTIVAVSISFPPLFIPEG